MNPIRDGSGASRCNTAYRARAVNFTDLHSGSAHFIALYSRNVFRRFERGRRASKKHCSPKRVWIVWTIPGRNTSGERYACRRRASCRAVDFPLRCWRASWRAGISRDGAALCSPGSTSRGISTLRDTGVRTRRCRAVHKFLTRLAHAKLSPRKMLRRMDENT